MNKSSSTKKLILVLLSLFLSAVIIETGLRVGGLLYLSLQDRKNKISIEQKDNYRIMCIGESTTAFGNYPAHLEQILNKKNIGINFSVINKGVLGNTDNILSLLESDLQKYTPDMVIAMIGINDKKHIMEYKETSKKGFVYLLKSFRIYKLLKLIRLHFFSIYYNEQSIFQQPDNPVNSNTSIPMTATDHYSMEYNDAEYYEYLESFRSHRIKADFDKAEAVLKEAILKYPDSDLFYLKYGHMCGVLQKHKTMIEMYQKALQINPRSINSYFEFSQAHIQIKDFNEAEKILKTCIDNFPDNHLAYTKLGEFYFLQKQYTDAENALMTAIKLNPDSIDTYRYLTVLYGVMGKKYLSQIYIKKVNLLESKYYDLMTYTNYKKLIELLHRKKIRLTCVQYPMRDILPLKKITGSNPDIIFVDNESSFKDAVKKNGYDQYFSDIFAGDFGHFKAEGAKLIAENIAEVLIGSIFNK